VAEPELGIAAAAGAMMVVMILAFSLSNSFDDLMWPEIRKNRFWNESSISKKKLLMIN
jgi:hypothetical protein